MDGRPVTKAPNDLQGLRVFVVEDEFAVLILIEDMLEEIGCMLAGTASRINVAMDSLAKCETDIALLDVNVAGQPVYPVAEAFAARGVPVVFSTGYDSGTVTEPWRRWPILQKPYNCAQLASALESALASR
jgi:two-component SAPR family response regulator